MRATGIIRRIDDLGRIVIPREFRKSLQILEGDPLEIYTDEDCITFKKVKVEPEGELKRFLYFNEVSPKVSKLIKQAIEIIEVDK